MKVVINSDFGCFSLSEAGIKRFGELNGWNIKRNIQLKSHTVYADYFYFIQDEKEVKIFADDIERNNPFLVQVVQELGKDANGECATLSIVEIPDDVKWEIKEYDGIEHVAGKHQTWS